MIWGTRLVHRDRSNMCKRVNRRAIALLAWTTFFLVVWNMPTAEVLEWPEIAHGAVHQISDQDGEISERSGQNPGVDPKEGPPGSLFTVRGARFRSFDPVESIRLGGIEVLGNQIINTDSGGNFVAVGLVVPGLDPGIYALVITVGNGKHKTTTSTSFEVTQSSRPGVVSALTQVGFAPIIEAANLERVFFFQNTRKDWLFFDPREAFATSNTLLDVRDGEIYWVKVRRTETVTLNGMERTLTCAEEGLETVNCWNVLVR